MLVIEAFGVSDNEVFARAWCSFWGRACVVADVGETCPGCAVREARAVGVRVVVLVLRGGEVEKVDRGMENLG